MDTVEVTPPGLRGEQWEIIATDDKHQVRRSYTFTTKGMASEPLDRLISKIQTQYAVRVHSIQMDGCSEFYGTSIKRLENSPGVRAIKTPHYTSELNGIAKRCNRIVFDKVRATIESEKIPINLWPLVLEDMVRKTDITAIRVIDSLTPMESFLDKILPRQVNKPDL